MKETKARVKEQLNCCIQAFAIYVQQMNAREGNDITFDEAIARVVEAVTAVDVTQQLLNRGMSMSDARKKMAEMLGDNGDPMLIQ